MGQPAIIQGGMGIGVSDWRLARAVSRLGQLGVVSGTAINTVVTRRLQDGDPGGHVRRAAACFPDRAAADELVSAYFLPNGRPSGRPYKRTALVPHQPGVALQRMLALAGFIEVYLAKEGHDGVVGINLLEKVQVSNLPVLYGAMLAKVDYVLMGAGIPREIPGALDLFSRQREASLKVSITGGATDAESRTTFDPALVFPTLERAPLKRPLFLAIVSSATLATHLARKSTGRVDGFVIEGPTAGGHNAPPRGAPPLNAQGEPVYGEKDVADLAAIAKLGLPFWVAGSFGTPEKLREALRLGAAGIQVGTAFAFCDESGLSPGLKLAVLREWCSDGPTNAERVFTDPLASPTGFPFKVVPLAGTLAQTQVYDARPRKCDLGFLRQLVRAPDGSFVYRCPAEPVADYVRKGGRPEETASRKCLCNALLANIGQAQLQEDGYEEMPLLTAGDELAWLKRLVPAGRRSFGAADVIGFLTGSL